MENVKKVCRLIVIAGEDEINKQFLKEALCHIISMSGYVVNAKTFEEPEEADFHVITCEEFSIEKEAKASLVYCCIKNPENLIDNEAQKIAKLYELIKWCKSMKMCYIMDSESPVNSKGLHNYENLRNIIMPLNFAFKNENMVFSNVKPIEIIEALVPDYKQKSEEARKIFEKKLSENETKNG